MTYKNTIHRSLDWFRHSGIMRPEDGSAGVAERLVLTSGNAAMEKITQEFPVQSEIAPGVVVLEHRRADCGFQVACIFELAAQLGDQVANRAVADNILDYLMHRSGLRMTDASAPNHGLWGWSNPVNAGNCWSDDNSWVVMLLLWFARRGREELTTPGIEAARTLCREARRFLDHMIHAGRDEPFHGGVLHGNRLNPHWLGLVCMALAYAAAVDDQCDYAGLSRDYFRLVPDGPPAYDKLASRPTSTGLPWTISEYAYLSLAASIAARQFGCEAATQCAKQAADILVRYQEADGHFRSEHWEAPAAEHLADLIYTQNWATLGLAHCASLLNSEACRSAHQRSLNFLAAIQDQSPSAQLAGCWRGQYDTRAGQWGGGDAYEGGANSIYSGWTNAPITLAFLLNELHGNLFA